MPTLQDLVAVVRRKYGSADGSDFRFDDVDSALAIQVKGTDVHRALRNDGGASSKDQIDLTYGESLPKGRSPVEDFFPTIQMPVALSQQRHMVITCRVWQECLGAQGPGWKSGSVDVVRGLMNEGSNPRLQLRGSGAVDELRRKITEGNWLVFLHQKGRSSYEAFRLYEADWQNSSAARPKEMFDGGDGLQRVDFALTASLRDPSAIGSNIVFYGPPGTSKSFNASERVGAANSFRTQFHPEYTHSDFVGAYRPVVGSERKKTDTIVGHDGLPVARPVNYFEFVPGPFIKALAAAYSALGMASPELPPEHVYLIVEEINRGDCAAIFGEVFQLLDRDPSRAGRSEYGIFAKPEIQDYFTKEGVHWDIAGDGRIYIPPNMTIFATMNTCDQALFPMDSAFKRRWDWAYCPVHEEAVLTYTRGIRPFVREQGSTRVLDWISTLRGINERIRASELEDKQLGPWFVKPRPDGEIPWPTVKDKVLFYLWHDVFNTSVGRSPHSIFVEDLTSFHELQSRADSGGLGSVFIAGVCVPVATATV